MTHTHAGRAHFLLPADGWGAVASEGEARKLAPDDAKRLGDWRRRIKSVPTTKGGKASQVARLQAVSRRVERLWDLERQRLALSEQEIRREIAVWGAHGLPPVTKATQRDQIKADLEAEGSPYWRLKLVMDTWCALWFWPLDKATLVDGSDPVYERTATRVIRPAAVEEQVSSEVYEKTPLPFDIGVPEQPTLPGTTTATRSRPSSVVEKITKPVALPSLDNWLDFIEAVVGRSDIPDGSLVQHFANLAELDDYERDLPTWTGSDSPIRLFERFPWLDAAHQIADEQGFFHWEIEFVHAFASGGFDLQVGNPPWVKPRWLDDVVLAEYDPRFALADDEWENERSSTKSSTLSDRVVRNRYLGELVANKAISTWLTAPATYAVLAATQPDLYRGFIARTWSDASTNGVVGLIHPDTHLTGPDDFALRAACYTRLRLHAHFSNLAAVFPDIRVTRQFSINIYGGASPDVGIRFQHASWLFSAECLRSSIDHDGHGELPGMRYKATWDTRPHRARLTLVDHGTLAGWQKVRGADAAAIDQTPILYPITTAEERAIRALAEARRLGEMNPFLSSGLHQDGAKQSGLISQGTLQASDWADVILRGPHLGVATPFSKQAPDMGRSGALTDLTALDADAIPATDYRRASELDRYHSALATWDGRRETEFFRVAWREMIPFDTERSLYAAIIPPGPSHVHAVMSLALPTLEETVRLAGFWSALPLDYMLRIVGRGHLGVNETPLMPTGEAGHPLEAPLQVRVLRLNCLTRAYSELWSSLFRASWQRESWANHWPGLSGLGDIEPTWGPRTPLRNEMARRAALVELDCLVSVWLGIGIDELIAILRARYPVLSKYDASTFFDAGGRKLSLYRDNFGPGQTRKGFDALIAHLDDPEASRRPEGYSPPFYKADREGEYRQAHAVFSAQLQAAADAGWEPSS